MVSLAIDRLRNRVSAPDIETAWRARALLDRAARALPPALDALLPAVLDAAGVGPEAVVALRRLDVRLPLTDDPQRLAAAWARHIVAALAKALRATPQRRAAAKTVRPDAGAAGAPEESADAVAFADVWQAEAALWRLFASGEDLPWWAPATSGETRPPAIVAAWIERDPSRAAAALMDLARTAPETVSLLSPAAARRLALRLLERLAAWAPAAAPGGENFSPATAASRAAAEAALRAAAAAVPVSVGEGVRNLLVLAALMAQAPAVAVRLAAATRDPTGPDAVLSRLAEAAAAAPPVAILAETAPALAAQAAKSVMHGGLLLLLRPLTQLGLLEAPEAPRDLLTAVALAAMRRLCRPLSPAARRALMERDRLLLSVFAGAEPPDAPLDTLPVAEPGEAWLDAALAVAPRETVWAAGVERRVYGGVTPFEADTPDDLLGRLLLRPAHLTATPWSAEATWGAADLALRRAGWDIDPGWLPFIGRTVRFHFDPAAEP